MLHAMTLNKDADAPWHREGLR